MPPRGRASVGLIGSLLVLASSGPHSLLGWPALRQVLLQSQVPADTMLGLSIGWYFGGLAIAVFGLIAALSFVQVLRGHPPHEPFPLVFIVPGLLVLTGATAKHA